MIESQIKKEHKWKNQYFKNPIICELCKEYIWGLFSQGFQCEGK